MVLCQTDDHTEPRGLGEVASVTRAVHCFLLLKTPSSLPIQGFNSVQPVQWLHGLGTTSWAEALPPKPAQPHSIAPSCLDSLDPVDCCPRLAFHGFLLQDY